jgi:putative aminopeptidase FrvX
MTAVSGYERAMTDSVAAMLPGATRDRAGNIVLTLGAGEPRRLIACPLDEPGFVVGGIRADGYLTLRRAGPTPGPFADQQYEGQRVTLFGRHGAVPGVVGVRSVHLARGRQTGDVPFTFDDAYVDVGAGDAGEVARLGIEILTPLARAKAPVRYGDTLLAAPEAGRRTSCAALLRAARSSSPATGSVTVAFLVEQSFTRRGLLTVIRTRGPFVEGILLEGTQGAERVGRPASPDPTALPRYETWGLRVRYAGTPVETVSLPDADRLERDLRQWIGGTP